jgi:hypothetical protein
MRTEDRQETTFRQRTIPRHEPEVERANFRANSEIALNDETAAAVAGDREWFVAHPERKYRIRSATRSEALVHSERRPPDHLFVIVERVSARFRWRYFLKSAVPIKDDDKVLRATVRQAAETSAHVALNFWGAAEHAALQRHSPSKT